MPVLSPEFLWTIVGGVLFIGIAWGHLRSRANTNSTSIETLRKDMEEGFRSSAMTQKERDDRQDDVSKEIKDMVVSHKDETNRKFDDQNKLLGDMRTTLATVATNVTNLVGWTGKVERRLDATQDRE